MSHHDLPPEKCGMSVTKCHKCGTVLELPAVHMRICMLADRADALAGLLDRSRVMVEEITIRIPRHVSREYGPQDPLGAHALLQDIDDALAEHASGAHVQRVVGPVLGAK